MGQSLRVPLHGIQAQFPLVGPKEKTVGAESPSLP
jgi:hypothetical protein